jgi:hypothetical protein
VKLVIGQVDTVLPAVSMAPGEYQQLELFGIILTPWSPELVVNLQISCG